MLLCPEMIPTEPVRTEMVATEIQSDPIAIPVPTCRHCGAARVNRPKGLCWSCYTLPGLKEQYESVSKFGKRGDGNAFRKAPLPLMATAAQPGSEEKVRVMMERARQGVQLFHPEDARLSRYARAG